MAPGETDELLDAIREAASLHDGDRVEELSGELARSLRDRLAEHPAAFEREVRDVADSFDRRRAAELCEMLVDHLAVRGDVYPLPESKQVLSHLRRKRWFELLVRVADALIQSGQDAFVVRRQYAQGLIDQGLLTAALAILRGLVRDCEDAGDAGELAEARGLLGRVRKQEYVDAAARAAPPERRGEALKEAIGHYADEFRSSGELIWHGVNSVALLARARRDGVAAPADAPDLVKSAGDILKSITAKKVHDAWDLATAAEACLATDDYAPALEWIVQYTESAQADAFEIASTLRQFEEVWSLSEDDPEQAGILHLLRSALLQREGGRVELTEPRKEIAVARALESDVDFEKVLGADRYRTFRWYRTGLVRAAGVAKIVDLNGNGHGTGFLLEGADVHASLDGARVLVTNAHVVSSDPQEQDGDPPALPPDRVRVRFEGGDRPDEEHDVGEIVFSSPRRELDCTIVTLPEGVDLDGPMPMARRLPRVDRSQRVYVIGHPRGGGLAFSIDDNLLLDHHAPKIHYRAPTEGGSSGSPVFNQEWRLIGLHHAGSLEMKKLNGKTGTYAANEGIAIQSILSALRATLG